jgi:low affinity Fe/Cu permease
MSGAATDAACLVCRKKTSDNFTKIYSKRFAGWTNFCPYNVMKSAYSKIENAFDKFVNLALKIYGSALTFIAAVICVIIFLCDGVFYKEGLHNMIRDIIMCVTFLSFFIIQKGFNKYAAAIHLKINELVSSHDNASNDLLDAEHKTEEELKEMAKSYHNKKNDSSPGNEKTE